MTAPDGLLRDAGGARPASDVDALIEQFPEINPGNYGEDDAIALNNWGIDAVAALAELREKNARHGADHNRIGAKCDALQQKVGRMRRALRQLNKAHRVLWRVILYRNEFHDFAVKQGAFIEFRNATEKRP